MEHPSFHWIPSGCQSAPIWSLLQHESNYMISRTVQKHDISEQQELPIFASLFQTRKKIPLPPPQIKYSNKQLNFKKLCCGTPPFLPKVMFSVRLLLFQEKNLTFVLPLLVKKYLEKKFLD